MEGGNQNQKQSVVAFVFRRDYRLHDNTTFIETVKLANEHGWKVLPIFVFDPQQADASLNPYHSNNCVQFMVASLRDLEEQLAEVGGKLRYFHGSDEEAFGEVWDRYDLRAIASNKDITPFALRRDEQVRLWCDKKGIPFVQKEDYTMYPIESVRTNQGKPFEIYTPFYRRAIRIPVPDPHSIPEMTTAFVTEPFWEENATDIDKYYEFNEFLELKGGRREGLAILESIRTGAFRKFKKDHDFPIKDCTTKLSPYLKFGCVSVREAFKVVKDALGKASLLVGQLYYREFYYTIAYHFPEILKGQVGEKNTPMHGRYEKAEWNKDEEAFEKWKTGMTGHPIVDAAMRCLNKTGWLHGRLRQVVAMFLVRDLDVDWREAERYLATRMVDYDPASSSQGWCWVLSYRRKFNPYKQTGKYDAQCEFVKKWVPELADVPVLDIICWWEKQAEHPELDYPKQMIDIQGYRVKFKTYIPDYVRPKDPNYKKTPKKSKYGNNKNKEKYDKNKERNKLLKQQKRQQELMQLRQQVGAMGSGENDGSSGGPSAGHANHELPTSVPVAYPFQQSRQMGHSGHSRQSQQINYGWHASGPPSAGGFQRSWNRPLLPPPPPRQTVQDFHPRFDPSVVPPPPPRPVGEQHGAYPHSRLPHRRPNAEFGPAQ